MKKIISLILSAVLVLGVTAQARVGDKIGMALNTDIVVYINNYAIPSYAVNGTSCIVAEDLRNFGFDVAWNGVNKTLSIRRNRATTVNPMSFEKTAKTGSFFADLFETDIVVFADGYRVSSYAMNGYTMIPVEELTMFGSVNWVESDRALKLWVDGLHVRDIMQPIVKNSATMAERVYGFDTIANSIIDNGEYDYDSGIYFVSYFGGDMGVLFGYKPSNNQIGMLIRYHATDFEISLYVYKYEYETPFANVDIGDEYSTYWTAEGYFDGYGNTLSIYESDFPVEYQEVIGEYIDDALYLADEYAVEMFGASIRSLGISYNFS